MVIRIARGIAREDFLDRAAAGHAVADHDQILALDGVVMSFSTGPEAGRIGGAAAAIPDHDPGLATDPCGASDARPGQRRAPGRPPAPLDQGQAGERRQGQAGEDQEARAELPVYCLAKPSDEAR